ncbi:MAG: LysE family translocator [Victivallales bacterium]|nr:LysE family translocator [Victivallales bacterium]
MDTIYLLITVFIYGITITVTPGPNNFMLLSSGLNFGIRKSLPHCFGIWTGNIIMLTSAALGLAVLFTDYPAIHYLLKILSSAFLLYLSWKFGTTAPKSLNCNNVRSKPLNFFQACLFQWVNPKAWIFSVTSITVFIPSDNNVLRVTLMVVSVLVVTMIISTFIWLTGGFYLEKIFKTPKQQKIFNICLGIILALTVIPILFVNVR